MTRHSDERLEGCMRIAVRLIKPDTVAKAALTISLMTDFVKEK
jgi:hypothetical protein